MHTSNIFIALLTEYAAANWHESVIRPRKSHVTDFADPCQLTTSNIPNNQQFQVHLHATYLLDLEVGSFLESVWVSW